MLQSKVGDFSTGGTGRNEFHSMSMIFYDQKINNKIICTHYKYLRKNMGYYRLPVMTPDT